MYRVPIAALLLLVASSPAGAGAETQGARTLQPNIVLLIADDLGWVDVSTGRTNLDHGSMFHQTPNIDRLAEEGMSFTAAYAQQNCAPTRASLMTGQYPPRHGVYTVGSLNEVKPEQRDQKPIAVPAGLRANITPKTVTIAETLGSAGYRSAAIGKVHGFGPASRVSESHGFDLVLASKKKIKGANGWHHYLARKQGLGGWGFARTGYDRFAEPYTLEYVEANLVPFANGNDPRRLVGTPKHLTDAIADAAIDFIRRNAAADHPFFLEVAFHAVHTPITPRRDLAAKYAGLKTADLRHWRPNYAALVEGLDQSVGRIVAALDDPNGDGDVSDGIGRRTLVVFLSDNGGAGGQTKNAPLRGGKGWFLEGGVRVPLIARMPGSIAPGSVSDEGVHVVDFYPTFAELAGAPLPNAKQHALDGESLVPLLMGEASRLRRTAIFWHFPGYLDHRMTPSSIVNARVGDRRYKLTYTYEDGRYRLHDLTADLSESRNLLAGSPSAEHLAVAARLSTDLRRWLRRVRAKFGWVKAINKPVRPPAPIETAPSEKPNGA